MKNYPFFSLLLLILTPFIYGCSGSEKVLVNRVEHETYSYYMSSTGSDFMRNEINKALQSVTRLYNTVTYRTYYFDPDQLPEYTNLINTNFEENSVQSAVDQQSSAGSALVLRNNRGKSVLLTASHTVSYPDTVWHFLEDSEPVENRRVTSVSVKERMMLFLIGSGSVYDFDVEINDPNRDLALITRSWEQGNRPRLEPLALNTGRSEYLEWTDKVYAIGYPKGLKMVTEAMVSKSRPDQWRNFVLDASFNRGFSGGAVFAERGDGTGMEWVGIVTSASAELEEYLIPEDISDEEYRIRMEYTGRIFAHRSQRINYGITFAVGIDQIRNFYNENREELRLSGSLVSILE